LDSDVKYASPVEPGRIACPFCGEPIAIGVDAVLSLQPIVCGSCGAELAVNQAQSREALATLTKWHAETAEARETTHADAEPPSTSRALRREKRRWSSKRR
jgi:transcription elongation factor Elf1